MTARDIDVYCGILGKYRIVSRMKKIIPILQPCKKTPVINVCIYPEYLLSASCRLGGGTH